MDMMYLYLVLFMSNSFSFCFKCKGYVYKPHMFTLEKQTRHHDVMATRW